MIVVVSRFLFFLYSNSLLVSWSEIDNDAQYQRWLQESRAEWLRGYELPFNTKQIFIDVLHAQIRATERICVLIGLF